MMARRGEAVWQVPHNEPQHSQRALQALPKGAPRRTGGGIPVALRIAFLGRNAISARQQRGAGRTRLV